MKVIQPEIEIVDRSIRSIRYLEHGWPTELCRWHSHAEYELHFVVETHGKAFIGDYIGDFTPGTLVMTGPNLPHNWVTDEFRSKAVPIRDMLVQFSQTSFDNIIKAFPEFSSMNSMLELAQSGVEFVGFDPATAKAHLEAIRDAKGAERIVAFLRLMVCVNDHEEKKVLSVSKLVQPEGDRRRVRIGRVIDYIVTNFAEELSVETAAEIAGMSPATFSRNFQAGTGNRFVEFVNRVRIGRACSRLYATNDQISSICYDVGFQNLANFNRHFLKMKGMSPSVYRKTAQNGLLLQQKVAS